jgi:hypothetical protein
MHALGRKDGLIARTLRLSPLAMTVRAQDAPSGASKGPGLQILASLE